MNFILRLKNKATLTAIVGAILLFIKQITEAFGVDLSEQIEQVSGLIGAIITFLVGIGVVTDPTTVGVKDSGITKTYTKPRDENIDPVEYQRKGYEREQGNDDLAEEVEIEECLRDVEVYVVIVDNIESDINISGVMLDTNQQVEGVVENGENTITVN